MKTPRLIALIAAALLCAASLQSSSAAEVTVDISSFAPREPEVIIRQIELNVAIKQYEKVLTGIYEARLQADLGPAESSLTDEQRKQWEVRAKWQVEHLENAATSLRKHIQDYIAEANKDAEAATKDKAKETAAAPRS